jgi:hypothetical protein
MRWLDASELCAGCKKLDTPWTAYGGRYVSNEISAMGPGPTHVAFTVNLEVPDPRHASPIGVVISPDGRVLHAHRTDMSVLCARAYGPVLSSGGVAAVHYRLHGETLETTRQLSQVLPVSRLAELLVSADGRFTWPDTEWRGVTEFDASSRLTAVNFMGNVVVGDLQTGAHAEIDALAGALPGEYARAVVAGAAVFVRRGVAAQQDYREWWVYEQGSLRHFVGNPTEDATALGTDGKSIVWRRGRDPVGTGFDTKWTTDLYVSSFTTDEAKLVPRLLLRDVPWTFSFLVLANGWVAGTHIVPGTENERALLLVRLSDGMALRSELPEPQEWAGTPYPGETELWASVAPTPAAEYASTLVRIPYSAMQVVQSAAPTQ